MCTSCGNLRSVCSDPSIDWHPRTTVCWASGTREWGRRILEKRYEKSEFPTDALTPLDGRAVYVTEVAPPLEEDEFADLPGEGGAIVLRMD